MFSLSGGASEASSARIGSAWKRFRYLGVILVVKEGLSLKQCGRIYQSCVRLTLLYCSETGELTVADELRLCGVEWRMISMLCGIKPVDRVSSDVLRERISVAVMSRFRTS